VSAVFVPESYLPGGEPSTSRGPSLKTRSPSGGTVALATTRVVLPRRRVVLLDGHPGGEVRLGVTHDDGELLRGGVQRVVDVGVVEVRGPVLAAHVALLIGGAAAEVHAGPLAARDAVVRVAPRGRLETASVVGAALHVRAGALRLRRRARLAGEQGRYADESLGDAVFHHVEGEPAVSVVAALEPRAAPELTLLARRRGSRLLPR